jgi:hypothetical protein
MESEIVAQERCMVVALSGLRMEMYTQELSSKACSMVVESTGSLLSKEEVSIEESSVTAGIMVKGKKPIPTDPSTKENS